MTVWFDGSDVIACDRSQIEHALEDLGAFYLGVVSRMPGLTVELIDAGEDFVTIQTNEGLMKRTNIVVTRSDDEVAVELDEVYDGGKLITASSHFRSVFEETAKGLKHHVVISNLEAPGFLGFFYRKFGSANIGAAYLKAHRLHLEATPS